MTREKARRIDAVVEKDEDGWFYVYGKIPKPFVDIVKSLFQTTAYWGESHIKEDEDYYYYFLDRRRKREEISEEKVTETMRLFVHQLNSCIKYLKGE